MESDSPLRPLRVDRGRSKYILKLGAAVFGCAAAILAFFATPRFAASQPVIEAVVNAASYGSGTVSPGEMVVIFGTALGPSQLTLSQPDANNSLPTSLAGVS